MEAERRRPPAMPARLERRGRISCAIAWRLQGKSVSPSVIVASWLLAVEPGHDEEVEASLEQLAGTLCRGKAAGRLVVVTESPIELGLAPVQQTLLGLPGARDVALVAAFEDEEDER